MKFTATMLLAMNGAGHAMPVPLFGDVHMSYNLTSPDAFALNMADLSLADKVAELYGTVTTGLEDDQGAEVVMTGGKRKLSGCTDSISYNPSYEVVPTNIQEGGAMIGGCGGTYFQKRKYGQSVKILTVYTGSTSECPNNRECIKGVSISFFSDSNTHFAGDTKADSDNTHTHTFLPGETIDSFVLTGNGVGTRLGHISFKTSLDKSFSVGTAHTNYKFQLQGPSMISGIFGGASSEQLMRLGLTMWKPVTSIELTSIQYPTLSMQARVQSPDSIYERTYCNDNSVPRKFGSLSVTKKVTTGSTSCFTLGTSFSYSQQFKITTGSSVPGLVKAEAESTSKFEVSASAGFENCATAETQESTTLNLPAVEVQPHTRLKYLVSQWYGRLTNLKFTARLKMTFADGKTWSMPQDGTYDGTFYNSLDSVFTGEEKGVMSCQE